MYNIDCLSRVTPKSLIKIKMQLTSLLLALNSKGDSKIYIVYNLGNY